VSKSAKVVLGRVLINAQIAAAASVVQKWHSSLSSIGV
jgi:hypothetical protein